MNEIENHVVSSEFARKLKEAGYPQESLNYWYPKHQIYLSNGSLDTIPEMLVSRSYRNGTSPNNDFIAAPITSEIANKIPLAIRPKNTHLEYYLVVSRTKNLNWTVLFVNEGGVDWFGSPTIASEKLADALAKAWIYLKEKGLL